MPCTGATSSGGRPRPGNGSRRKWCRRSFRSSAALRQCHRRPASGSDSLIPWSLVPVAPHSASSYSNGMSSATDRVLLGVAPWPLVPSLSPDSHGSFHGVPQRRVRALVLVSASSFSWSQRTAPRLLVPWAARRSQVLQSAILWRTRAGSGRSQGLPPGPLPLVPAAGFVTDPQFVAKHIARYGPVSKTLLPTMAQPVVLVSGLQRGADVLRNNDERLKWVGMSFDSQIPAGFIRSMNPSDHRHYRSSSAERIRR